MFENFIQYKISDFPQPMSLSLHENVRLFLRNNRNSSSISQHYNWKRFQNDVTKTTDT